MSEDSGADGYVTPRTYEGDVGYKVFSHDDEDEDDFIAEFQKLLGFQLHQPDLSPHREKKKKWQRGIVTMHEDDLRKMEEEEEAQEKAEAEERERKEREMKTAIVFLVRVKKAMPKGEFRKFFDLLVKLIKAGNEDSDVLKFLRNDAKRVFKNHPDLFEEFDQTFLRLPENTGKKEPPLHPRIGRPSARERYTQAAPSAPLAGGSGGGSSAYSNSILSGVTPKPKAQSLRSNYDATALAGEMSGADLLGDPEPKPKKSFGPSEDFLISSSSSTSYSRAPAGVSPTPEPTAAPAVQSRMKTVSLGGGPYQPASGAPAHRRNLSNTSTGSGGAPPTAQRRHTSNSPVLGASSGRKVSASLSPNGRPKRPSVTPAAIR